MTYQEAEARLKALGQEHLLQFYGELDEREREALLAQIAETDFSCLKEFPNRTGSAVRGVITPLPALTAAEIGAKREEYRRRGLEALQAGKLACVLLAGGMGTRLGCDGPKGTCDIGVTHPVYIFQRLFEELARTSEEAGVCLPLFIMTSEANDEATQSFLREHGFFGYPSGQVHFFCQEMAPCADEDGLLLLDSPGRLAVSPNGNGGWLLSLERSGMLDLIRRSGAEWLNVFSVDNVLQRIGDPVFLGAVLASGCASGSKVVRKASPEEKVGVMCLEDGKTSVIEYFEMSDELLHARDEAGDYAYYYGVILNYLFRIEDAAAVMHRRLPLHFAHKKIPYTDRTGVRHEPAEPNGWKFEYFIFDLLHELDGCLPYEVVREEEFAPVKNRTGVDSIESARELLRARGYRL